MGCLLAAIGIVVLGTAAGAAPSPLAFTRVDLPVEPPPRLFRAAATTADGTALLVGGGGPDGSAEPADTWTYTNRFGWTAHCGTTTPDTDPCPIGVRVLPGVGRGPDGVVLYGGFVDALGDGTNTHDDAWVWDGSEWQPICDGCPPGGRGMFAMAGNGEVVVLYGGVGPGGPLNDTWVFDGTTWTNTCGGSSGIPCGPTSLMGAAMVWDGVRFVMFGGAEPVPGDPVALDDTWAFDGATWAKICGASGGGTPCGPDGRALASIASVGVDAAGGAVMMQGGNIFGAEQSILRDAWRWDRTEWSQLAVPWDGPPVVWPEGEGPPRGSWPLIGSATAAADPCQVVYATTGVDVGGLFTATYLGADPAAGCVGDPVTTTSSTPATTPTSTASQAGTAPAARIANTGPASAGRQAVLGAALVAAGGACLVLARAGRRRTTPAHR